jgi:cholesterol transport system auxiliary component
MNPLRIWFATAAAALSLTACSMLGAREDFIVYAPTVAHPPAAAASSSARAWALIVAEPRAISPLNSTRIAVMPTAGEIQTFKGVRWRDASPVLLQQLLIQAFQDSARLSGIGPPTSILHADFALQTDLRDFQAEYRGAKVPTVVISLNGQLIDNSTGLALARQLFTIEQPCEGTAIPQVFAAFQVALDRLLPQVVAWTTEAGDLSWSRKAAR